ncbi:MAG: hypothetical protein WCS77_10055 [Elusimicrobiaceae bacterium]
MKKIIAAAALTVISAGVLAAAPVQAKTGHKTVKAANVSINGNYLIKMPSGASISYLKFSIRKGALISASNENGEIERQFIKLNRVGPLLYLTFCEGGPGVDAYLGYGAILAIHGIEKNGIAALKLLTAYEFYQDNKDEFDINDPDKSHYATLAATLETIQ